MIPLRGRFHPLCVCALCRHPLLSHTPRRAPSRPRPTDAARAPPASPVARALARARAHAPRRIVTASLVAAVALAVGLASPLGGPRGEVLQVVSGGQELASPSPAASAVAIAPGTPRPTATDDDIRPAALPRPTPAGELTGYVLSAAPQRPTSSLRAHRVGLPHRRRREVHDGIDLATFCGDRIVAAHDGIVLAARRRYDQFMGWRGDLQPYLDRLEAEDSGSRCRSSSSSMTGTATEACMRTSARSS